MFYPKCWWSQCNWVLFLGSHCILDHQDVCQFDSDVLTILSARDPQTSQLFCGNSPSHNLFGWLWHLHCDEICQQEDRAKGNLYNWLCSWWESVGVKRGVKNNCKWTLSKGWASCLWIFFGCKDVQLNGNWQIYAVAVLMGAGGSTMLITRQVHSSTS